jgi:hypothetical protein
MPETVFDDVYENGVLVSRVERIVSDEEITRNNAPGNLRNAYLVLQSWADDAQAAAAAEQLISDGWATATAGQKDTANRQLHTRMAVTFNRLGIFFERFADLLVQQGLDQ